MDFWKWESFVIKSECIIMPLKASWLQRNGVINHRLRKNNSNPIHLLERFLHQFSGIRLGWFLQISNAKYYRKLLQNNVNSVISEKDEILRSYPSYWLDLSLCDFYLFGSLRKHANGKKFGSNSEFKEAVQLLLKQLTKAVYKNWFGSSWKDRKSA